MTSRPVFAPVLGLLVLAGTITPHAQPREFANVRELGRALVEYDDGDLQAVAAYHLSQRSHDSRWLLIELGMMGRRATVVGRDQVELVTPAGRVLPLATQRQWNDDTERARLLLQTAQPTRHQVRSYFRDANGAEPLRFFVSPGSGTVVDSAQVVPDQVLLGDLLFASPSGLWDRGIYALVVHRPTGTVRLPIELR